MVLLDRLPVDDCCAAANGPSGAANGPATPKVYDKCYGAANGDNGAASTATVPLCSRMSTPFLSQAATIVCLCRRPLMPALRSASLLKSFTDFGNPDASAATSRALQIIIAPTCAAAGGMEPLRHFAFPQSTICYACCCPMGTQRSNHSKAVGKNCRGSDVFKRLAKAYWVRGLEARYGLIRDASVSSEAKFAELVDTLEAEIASMETDLAAVTELTGVELDIAPFIELFELAAAVVIEALVHDDALVHEPEILAILQIAVSVASALHDIYWMLVVLYTVSR
ncbi:hypothetical protein NLJ89_g9584 [Agrocybe chaxingu]|uniref:Uncharacterized protein n=1 Tax=Agrocybe chaxingu TaxID=84603 RepID=A0A9W8JSF1_9AGAR|nr:hypothetical protein NLJ89_g9584 [Agrocybe chaxingu]